MLVKLRDDGVIGDDILSALNESWTWKNRVWTAVERDRSTERLPVNRTAGCVIRQC